MNDLRARQPFRPIAIKPARLQVSSNTNAPGTDNLRLNNSAHFALSPSSSSPVQPKRTLQSSPLFRPVEDGQASPDMLSGAVLTTESSNSPVTPSIQDEGAISDMSCTPTKTTFAADDQYLSLKDEFVVPQDLLHLTPESIRNQSDEVSKTKLGDAAELLRQATRTVQKYKNLVSQMKLQNQLLTIETHESAQRFEVENSLVKREVDRLRYEQIDHQHSLAAAAENRSDSDTYRRRLQKAKLKLKDAHREIEDRDRELLRIKKRLREGRLQREVLEEALVKGQGQRTEQSEDRDRYFESTPPPPANAYFGSSSSIVPSTPQSVKSRAGPIRRQDGESGLDALGFLASQALFDRQQPRAQRSESPENIRNRSVPAVSADFPRFDGTSGNINLPPLRIADTSGTGSQNVKGGLMSPVAFKEGPFSANSSPPSIGHALLNPSSPEKRRYSNASTITVTSDDEDQGNRRKGGSPGPAKQGRKHANTSVGQSSRRRSEDLVGGSGSGSNIVNDNGSGRRSSNPEHDQARSQTTSSSISGNTLSPGKLPKSPRKRTLANGSISKSGSSKSIVRSGSGNIATMVDRSPRTPPH